MNESLFPFSLPNYTILKTIGIGAFGRVYFIKSTLTNKPYALKLLKKSKLLLLNQVPYIHSEYTILKTISHPFIVSLHSFHQTSKHLFLIMEYLSGGELLTLMRSEISFSVSHTQFYIAQLIEALTYLHSHGIIYRDIKPENILFSEDGYIKLVDFGVAKRIDGKTFSLCGTPTYMAPEVVLRKGYSFQADWWSLGVLTYEMVVGLDPWDENDPVVIYQKVVEGKVWFPKNVDADVKSFIKHLMVGDPRKRMGINGSAKMHRWFKGFDWEKLQRREMQAWYIPKVRGGSDTRNYNEYAESESEGEEIEESDDPFANW